MVRSLIIIALLASLFYLVKYSQTGTEEPAGPGKVATSRQDKAVAEAQVDESSRFNPSVAAPLPDLNKGYVFSEKRKYEKDEPVEAAKVAVVEQGPDPITSVLYSGSIIVGDLRRALVTYQELAKEAGPSRPGGRGPAPAPSAPKNKQLNQGDRFLGYLVASVEPDRIVFEKGDLKVEKFLYDRGKTRLAAPELSPREAPPKEVGGVPLQAMAPPEILEALMNPTAARRNLPGARVGGPTIPAMPSPPLAAGDKGGDQAATAQSNRMVRRSQRFLGMDSFNVPVTPVPGLPVPNK
jgi:hypothetical protein